MSWITTIWSATAASCLTLAGAHFVVCEKLRASWANLLFSIAATSATACAVFEMTLTHAQTLGWYGAVLRWFHLPVAPIVVSLAWFARQCLRVGRLRLVWLITGVLLGPANLSAQTGLPSAQPGFGVLSWDSGGSVPGKSTTAMARTPDGYLWLGTQVGLIRFDGVRFVTLTTNATPALGDNRISSLLVDRDGALWIGTQGGTLSLQQAGEFQPVTLDPRLRGVSIESLEAGNQGEVWLATGKWGLIRLADGICDFSNSTSNLTELAARSMVRLTNGEWWAMGPPGLITFQHGTWQAERFGLKPGIWFWALAPSRQGSGLWLATETESGQHHGARVLKLEGGKVIEELAPYPWRQDSRHSRINSMVEDGKGRLWVGTELDGAFYWKRERGWRELKSREGRSYIQIREFFADHEGLLWMATSDGMLHRITERLVARVELPPEHAKDFVVSVCTTRDGNLWAGTEAAGVFRFREGGFKQVTNGLPSLTIYTMFEDSRTHLWTGTQRGLLRWSGDKFQSVPLGNAAGEVLALFEDRRGQLWAGYGPRVVQLHPDGRIQVFGRESGLRNSRVVGLAEDATGKIYASQEATGLFRLQGDRFEPVTRLGRNNLLRGVRADEDGSLWVTTRGQGLYRLDDDQVRYWRFEDGLPENDFRSIVPDGTGNLWFSGSAGIFGCSQKALLDYQRGKTPPVLFWRLGEADGMQGNWTSGYGQPLAARSADGRLWFPNRNVVAVIDPKKVTQRRIDPPPRIEEVIADGRVHPGKPGGTLQLLSGVRQLQIHYTCPDLQSPEVLRFRYCLEGFDDRWIEAGNKRVAHYGQLKPDDYRFRLEVGSDSGVWTECEAPLALSILPRWWERTLVRILGLLTVLGLLVGTTWRVGWSRHQRKIEKLELRLANKRSQVVLQTLQAELAHVQRLSTMGHLSTALAHELNQPLGAILSNAEAAEMLLDADPPSLGQVREILADIRKDDERAGEVIRRMRSLLRRQEMQMVPLDMRGLIQEVLRLVSGDAKLRKMWVRGELEASPLPTRGDRVHLQQVLLNLIVNGMDAVAGNPSEARRVIVQAGRNRDGQIEVAVNDNGPGIPAEQLPRLFEPFFTTKPNGMGMGTSIARSIVQAHHGRIWAENNPDGGAIIRFTLPVDEGPESRQPTTVPRVEEPTPDKP